MLYLVFTSIKDKLRRVYIGLSDKFEISRYCFQILCIISVVLVIYMDKIKELVAGSIFFYVAIACLIYLIFLALTRKLLKRQHRFNIPVITMNAHENTYKSSKSNSKSNEIMNTSENVYYQSNNNSKSRQNLNFELLYIALFVFVFTTVLLRSIFFIVIPCQNSRRMAGETFPVNAKIISYIFNENADSLFSNHLLGAVSFSDSKEKEEKEEIKDSKNIVTEHEKPTEQEIVLKKQEQSTSSEIILDTKFGKVSIYDEVNDRQYGDLIKADIRFSRFEPQRNPGGFDERKYYGARGIYLKGSIIRGSLVKAGKDDGLFYRFSYGLRTQIIKVFYKTLPAREAALMTGILLGDKTGISKEDKEVLNSAGLSHITAVSGSAVSFLIFPLKSLLKKMKASRVNKTIIMILFLLIFGFLTGWSSSVSRALFMVFIMLSANLLGKKINITQALSLTVFFLILYNPVYVLDAGFWLSVCATAGIIMFSAKIKNYLVAIKSVPAIIASSISMSLTAGISVLPVLIWMTGEISFSALVSNLFAVPLVELSLFSGVVLGMAGVVFYNSNFLFLFAVPLKGFLWVISSIASVVSSIDFLKIKLYNVTFAILFAAAGVAIFFAIKDIKTKKYVAVFSLLALLLNFMFSILYVLSRPELEVVFADVGQGDATLIILKTGESILIDSGGEKKGVAVIEGMLDYYNIKSPTIYIATHTHEDHCGAMVQLIGKRGGKSLLVPQFTKSDNEFDPKFVASRKVLVERKSKAASKTVEKNNQPLLTPARPDLFSGEKDMGLNLLTAASDKNFRILETGSGDVFSVNRNLKIKILSPDKKDRPDRKKGGNESSLIIQLDYKTHKIIIMGDATDGAEQLLSESGIDLSSNIFRISHHGSPKSTNHDIINAVNPKISIISVGYNLYGHPSEKVIKRLRDSGSNVLRTDESGAIIYKFGGEKVTCRTMIG